MMRVEIPTPAEIAERNRVKDEAADDALLEEWLPKAAQAIGSYRGRPVYVSLSVNGSKPRDTRYVLLTGRFLGAVRRRFVGTGWTCELDADDYHYPERIMFKPEGNP